jgi:hypothetical protein
LYDYPLLQIILLCGMSLIVLVLIIVKKPFNKKLSIIEFSIYEIMILLVHLCILVLAIMDYQGVDAQEARENLGAAMIIGFTAFGIIGLIFMGISVVVGVASGVKSFRKMKAAGSVNFILLLTIPFASYGMDFEDISGPEEGLRRQRSFKPKSLRQVVPLEKIQEDLANKSHSKLEVSTVDNLDSSALILTRTRGTLKDSPSIANLRVSSQKAHEKERIKNIFEDNTKLKLPVPSKFKLDRTQYLNEPSINVDFNPSSTSTSVDKWVKRRKDNHSDERRNSVIRDLFLEQDRDTLVTPAINNFLHPRLSTGSAALATEFIQNSQLYDRDTNRSSRYFLQNEQEVSSESPERPSKIEEDVEEYQIK